MLEQTFEEARQIFIPLSPVVAAWDDVELIPEMALRQQISERTVRRQ
jgi:hypothetical protein